MNTTSKEREDLFNASLDYASVEYDAATYTPRNAFISGAEWQAARSQPGKADVERLKQYIRDLHNNQDFDFNAAFPPLQPATKSPEVSLRKAAQEIWDCYALIPEPENPEDDYTDMEINVRRVHAWAGLQKALSHTRHEGGWQDISTAPKKDRQVIQVWQERKHWSEIHMVFWEEDSSYEDGGHWFISDGKNEHALRGDCLTHWRLAPAAPLKANGGM